MKKLDRTARPDRELLNHQLIVTHGLPASGKNSWADYLVAQHPKQFVKLRRHIYDDHGQNATRQRSKKHERSISRAMMRDALEHVLQGKTVIIADNNLDRKVLNHIGQAAFQHDVSIGQKYFDIPVQECIQRNEQRDELARRGMTAQHIEHLAAQHYGRDGRIKEYTFSKAGVMEYDRAGSHGEQLIAEFMTEQQAQYPIRSTKLANFDMDGTLVDTRMLSDRYMSPGKRNFHLFHSEADIAPANASVVADAMKAHEEGYTVSVTTARSDKYAKETIHWLRENKIPVAILKHRRSTDMRPDYEVKADMIEDLRYAGYDIVHSWDDNPQAVEAFRRAGIRVSVVPFHTPSETLQEYSEPVLHTSPFQAGICLRCGKPFQGEGSLGPTCRTKA